MFDDQARGLPGLDDLTHVVAHLLGSSHFGAFTLKCVYQVLSTPHVITMVAWDPRSVITHLITPEVVLVRVELRLDQLVGELRPDRPAGLELR